MSIHHLFDILLSHGPLPQKLLDEDIVENLKVYLMPVIATHVHSRRQLLLSAGQVAGHLYFLEKGLARGFYLHPETGKENTHFLWNKHSLITAPDSFYHQKPSLLFIEVMPDTELMSISYHTLMACINEFPCMEIFSRNVALQYAAYETKRSHDLTTLSAWERYRRLLQTHPDIEQQVSQAVIASYLTITPQSLSRMLREKGHP